MEKLDLKLRFLDNHAKRRLDPIEQVLGRAGDTVSNYAQGYFNYIVTTTIVSDEVREASLYILIPEIDYTYRVLSVNYLDVNNVSVEFFTLKTEQVETKSASLGLLESVVSELLSSEVANATFRYLVDLVEMKKERSDE